MRTLLLVVAFALPVLVAVASIFIAARSMGLSRRVSLLASVPVFALFIAGFLLMLAAVVAFVVASLLCFVELLAPPPAEAATRHWAAPVHGAPAKPFHLGADPFLRGQHRGVDFASGGGRVRAACGGRVVFAGRVAGAGTVSVRCGRWRVSYAPLTRVAVREGQRVGAGARLGRSAGGIHFGVRREGRRFGYVDPLRFFAAAHAPVPPVAVRPPASSRARPPDLPRPLAAGRHAVSQPAPTLAPWPVWAGLALGLTGLVGGGRLRLPFRRLGGAPCRASSISSSSPTTPSSP